MEMADGYEIMPDVGDEHILAAMTPDGIATMQALDRADADGIANLPVTWLHTQWYGPPGTGRCLPEVRCLVLRPCRHVDCAEVVKYCLN